MRCIRLFAFLLATVLLAESIIADDAVLLDDRFAAMRSGPLGDVVDALLEYHYLPSAAAKGNWSVSTFVSSTGFQRAWQVMEAGGAKVLKQTHRNSLRHTHPMLVAGDPAWRDTTLEVTFTPEKLDRRAGVALCYRNDRCYYFFGVEEGKLRLIRVRHETAFHVPDEKILAEAGCPTKPGQELRAIVRAHIGGIEATAGGVTLRAKDTAYAGGKVALIADGPTIYQHVRVTASPETAGAIRDAIAARKTEEQRLQARNPKLKLWKRIPTDGFGVGRNLRFGDLDGDGQIDILVGQVRHHGPKDRFSELSCLTAITLDGKMLWQIGEPDAWKSLLTNDVAFQIADFDGDGRNDVVYAMNQELVMVDGLTGKVKRRTPTPAALPPINNPDLPKVPTPIFPRILGDSLMVCDLRGRGRAADMLLKDRYQRVWAYDYQLRPLWQAECNTGHYPFPADIDGDGKDEVMVGYSLFDDNGTRKWTLQNQVRDHADGMAIVDLGAKPNDPPKVVCVASDEGMFIANLDGKIEKHHRIGHAQNVTIANFRDDLPGLEIVTMNFWGNQGIVHLYDSSGSIYHDFEPVQHGSMCLPVNWTGQGEELFLLSPNPEDGGMYDGHGRRALRFPADGHPDMCNAVMNLTGDPRDEIIVWDPYSIWIYTQDDAPKTGKLYAPKRNPPWTESNYRASVSLPAWTP